MKTLEALVTSTLFAAVVACGGPDEGAETVAAAITDPNAAANARADRTAANATRCGDGAIFFDGGCRTATFFERFVSDGAELVGVSGPVDRMAGDTGAIVLETVGDGAYQELFISPTKAAPGSPRSTRAIYRADYAIVFMRVTNVWQQDTGHLNVLVYALGPVFGRSGLTPVAWTHSIVTASGLDTWDSDGNHSQSRRSGGSGSYCEAGAIAVAGVATVACLGGDLVGSAAAGVVSGIVSGVVVFAVGTGMTDGVGAAPAALAGLGTGATIGVGVFAGTSAVGAVGCGVLGTVIGAVTSAAVCSEPDALDLVEFVPLRPATPVSVSGSGGCPSGMVAYTGSVMQCSETSAQGTTVIIDDDGNEQTVEDVTIESTCKRTWVRNECVFI